jgi:hypothetical protein
MDWDDIHELANKSKEKEMIQWSQDMKKQVMK